MYPNLPHLQFEDDISLIDTHCHLDLEPLYTRLPEVLEAARLAKVTGFIIPGVHPEGWERMAMIAQRHPALVFPAFGIHPMHADLVDDAIMARLAGLAISGVAIGEIGLDPNYSVSPGVQERAFREQLRLAVALGLPVIVHCRRAFQRTLMILQEENALQVGGVMHAFSGSPEMAQEFIRLGFVISLTGTLTWNNAVRPVRLARETPLDCLVLESDAPDLTPQTFKGQANQPAWLSETLFATANSRDMLVSDIAYAVLANTKRIFTKIS